MNQDLAVLIAALIVNVLAVIALSSTPSLTLSWLLFSVLSAATAVAVYSGWRVLDRALRLTTPTATRRASTSETAFQCSISDTTGLLVTLSVRIRVSSHGCWPRSEKSVGPSTEFAASGA
jgi:hypothetical protein